MDRWTRFGLITAVAAGLLFIPTVAASDIKPQVIEVVVTLTDQPAPIVNVRVPEQAAPTITLPDFDIPAPVVNVQIPQTEPPVIVVEPSTTPPPQVIYEDRTVEVERIVEVPACLNYADLPHFDLANALTAGFPGAQWGLSGSHYNGLKWYDDSPMPDMTDIIGAWLTHLESDC